MYKVELRGAIERTKNRRYPMFWASRGEVKGKAEDLCRARKGITVPIVDADSFFGNLVEQVEALARSQRQNPISVEMLVSRAKRYLSKLEHRIQLEDLVSEEVERVISRLDQDNISLNPPTDDKDKLRRILLCEGISEGLAKVCGLIGRWGNSSQVSVAADVIRAILSFANANTGERQIYLELREYPAVLAYHACTLGLQYSRNWSELHKFMGQAVPIRDGRPGLLLNVVGPSSWTGFGTAIWQEPGKEERYTPFNDHLADEIFPIWGRAFLPPRAPLADMTLLNEALTAIRYLEETSNLKPLRNRGRIREGIPYGRAGWSPDYRERVFPQIEDPGFLARLADAGFGRNRVKIICEALHEYNQFLENLGWHRVNAQDG